MHKREGRVEREYELRGEERRGDRASDMIQGHST